MTTNGGSLARSIIVGSYLVLFGALVGYFIWLGTTILDIRERVARIEVAAESLRAARERAVDERANRNTRRIEHLEGE